MPRPTDNPENALCDKHKGQLMQGHLPESDMVNQKKVGTRVGPAVLQAFGTLVSSKCSSHIQAAAQVPVRTEQTPSTAPAQATSRGENEDKYAKAWAAFDAQQAALGAAGGEGQQVRMVLLLPQLIWRN
jgi:hypothetical protein